MGKEYEGGANVGLETACVGILLLILMLLLLLLAAEDTGVLSRNNVPVLILFFSSGKIINESSRMINKHNSFS